MIKAFEIGREELKDIEYIAPSNKDYNLYLGDNQHWELSKSGKTLYLIQENEKGNYIDSKSFRVSSTIFVLKENE